MKKIYKTPNFDVVHFDLADVIVTSPIGVSNNSANSSTMYSRERNPIWNEEE